MCGLQLGLAGTTAAPVRGHVDVARILVATDFSPASDAALAFARKLARAFGAALHVIHVLEDRALRAVAERSLEAQIPPDERSTLQVTMVLLRGGTAATIVNYAATQAIDLIVMDTEAPGAHGNLGRIVDAVVRLGPCPVLTIKEERTGRSAASRDSGHLASTFV